MNAIKIICLCLVLAIVYGIIHDQITIRVCLEYFTVAHPLVENLDAPWKIALYWGIVATWWMGIISGTVLAFAANFGKRQIYPFGSLVVPCFKLIIVMFGCATVGGAVGYILCYNDIITLPSWLSNSIDPSQHARFMAAAFAHSTSYLVGIVGSIFLAWRTWRARS